MSSAFPSPVIGHGAHHNNHNNNQSACCGNLYSGSQTLPANCNGNGIQEWSSKSLSASAHTRHCHHSSSGDDAELQWWTISARTIGMFVLSLVFILIWTSVISGILVTHSYREHETANNAAELFALQKQIGQFAYLVGKEMVNILNTTFNAVSTPESAAHKNDTSSERDALMNATDAFLASIQPTFAQKDLMELYEDLIEIHNKFRARCHLGGNRLRDYKQQSADNDRQESSMFIHATECIRAYEHHFHTLESFVLKDNVWLTDRHTKLIQNDLIVRNLPYTLFIKGVLYRFTCLSIGMVLVESDFNTTLLSMSEYYHYYYSSRQLIESSFLWNQRFLSKYIDLEKTDSSSELMLKLFELRAMEESQFYDKMSSLFNQLIGVSGLRRIRSEMMKKNAESVERILEIDEGSGVRSKYVADPTQVHFQIKPELLLPKFGLEENIEQIIAKHDQMSSVVERRMNLSAKYNQVILNQFDFLARVQDFLNISISAQLVQSRLSEESNFVYHTMVSAILICSVLFCLLLFCCSYCFSRNPPLSTPYPSQRIPWGRRMRRQFWALGTSPLALLCSCFTGSSNSSRAQRPSQSSGNGSNRYPLLYKSSNHRSQSPSCHNGQASVSGSGACKQCASCSPSPSMFLMTSKRTWHRYLAAAGAHHHHHSYHHGQSQNGSHRHLFKARNGVMPSNGSTHRAAETAMVKLNSGADSNGDRCRSNSHGCCMACRDPSCTGFYDPGESTKYEAPVQEDKCICSNCSEAGIIDDDIGSMPPSTRLEKRHIGRQSVNNKDNNNKDSATPALVHKSLTRHASRESTLSVDLAKGDSASFHNKGDFKRNDSLNDSEHS